jgi:hypothetical protein
MVEEQESGKRSRVSVGQLLDSLVLWQQPAERKNSPLLSVT